VLPTRRTGTHWLKLHAPLDSTGTSFTTRQANWNFISVGRGIERNLGLPIIICNLLLIILNTRRQFLIATALIRMQESCYFTGSIINDQHFGWKACQREIEVVFRLIWATEKITKGKLIGNALEVRIDE